MGELLPVKTIQTDVLVLGAGLAGMRAAWAALEARPEISVMVVSSGIGPSGSSFSNINDKLGMQVCSTDSEKEDFARDAMSISSPGVIDPSLVQVLAEESEKRFRELVQIGVPFDKDDGGGYLRTSGCFSPGSRRAFIYSGLVTAFTTFRKKCLSLGGTLMEGWLVQDLIRDQSESSSGVLGALLHRATAPEQIAVQARSIVCALGGPASLFELNVAGPGTQGVSQALMNRTGVELINTAYLQFLWHNLPTFRFWPIQKLAQPDALYRITKGDEQKLPEGLAHLADVRSQHCPVSHGFSDEALDHFLINKLNENGWVEVFDLEEKWLKVGPMAHAGNGGAKIDKHGWTGVTGLYACGECASGMHGANRLGGAMVTATQVFGARAGTFAAQHASDKSLLGPVRFGRLLDQTRDVQKENEEEWEKCLPWIRIGLQQNAIPGRQSHCGNFMKACAKRLEGAKDWRLRLALEAALIIGSGG